MPYAHNGIISQNPIEGGIEITLEQYAEALIGITNGLEVTIDGGFKVAKKPEPEPDVPPLTPEEAKAVKLREINAECDRRINAEVLSYPSTEILTFAKQESEARAWLADNMAATPLIDALAASRGIDKAELIARIIVKADYFADYTGRVVGYRQKLEDRVNAAATPEELAAIDPLAGWTE